MSISRSRGTLRVASLRWTAALPPLLAAALVVFSGLMDLRGGSTPRLFWIWFPLASLCLAYLLIVLGAVAINGGIAIYLRGESATFLFPYPKRLKLSKFQKIELIETAKPFPRQALLFLGPNGTCDTTIVSAMVEGSDVIRERLLVHVTGAGQ
ncbi:hypothetical protein [Caulobacter segnis]|uniref:hypothetical protein n=1 Tax=Caulobacter segnis TaxID=88688 RepID=UPI0012EE506E|nr:hypothetical protein [Caulobacter segnis]